MNSTVPRFPKPKSDKKANADGLYRPNDRLLQRLYDHFKSTGKLKALEAGFAASAEV